MRQTHQYRSSLAAAGLLLAVLLVWPAAARAQTVTGDAQAVQATVFGTTTLLGATPTTTTTLADTGTLGDSTDARDASQLTGNIPSLLAGEALHAVTIGYPDHVDSEAAIEGLNLTVAGVGIAADSVWSQASSWLGGTGSGSSSLDNLSINGMWIAVTGGPNQTVAIPGGQVVINEQIVSPTGTTTVNALHVTVTGVADVVVASATAGIS